MGGGHVLEFCAMRPHDPRYTVYPLPDAPQLDATLTYVIARSPISNPLTRYGQAQKMKRDTLIRNSEPYVRPWDSIIEGNPQLILDRGEEAQHTINRDELYYLPESAYPHLACHPFNLIPVCHHCNAMIKGKANPLQGSSRDWLSVEDIFLPYRETGLGARTY
jgi:hypothetical protein